jgi:GntR family transcriptional regulator/MocR family aminotransferase
MVETLNSFIAEGIELDFTVPPGGMTLWVNVGGNAEEIAKSAQENNIFLLAEKAFHLESKNDENKFIRLGFAGQSEDQITQGLSRLKPFLNRKD